MGIKRLKNGTHEVRCRFHRRQVRRRFDGPNAKWEARDFERLVTVEGVHPDEAAERVCGANPQTSPPLLLLQDFIGGIWLRDLESGEACRSGKQPEAGSVDWARNRIRHVLPFIGHVPLADLGAAEWRDLKAVLKTHPANPDGAHDGLLVGPGVKGKAQAWGRTVPSLATIHRILATLRQVMHYAVQTGQIPSNPFTSCTNVHVPKVAKPFWKPEDCLRFLDHVRAANPMHFAFFLVALQTGLRRSELFGLRRMDVDTGRLVIMVRRQWDTDAYERPRDGVRRIAYKPKLKNGEPAKTIPITPALGAVLDGLTATLIRPDTPLFAMPIHAMKNPGKLLREYAESAKVPPMKMHGTRDSFIGNAKLAGVSDWQIAAIAGCTVDNLKNYGHLAAEDARPALRALAWADSLTEG